MSYPPPGQQPGQPGEPSGGYQPPGYPPPGYQPPGYPPGFPAPPPTSGKATTSLVLGVLSLVACGLVTGIPAMIVGRQAKREIASSNGQLAGEGLATAGFVTGLIGTLFTVLAALALIALFAVASGIESEFQQSCTEFNSQGEFTADC